MAHTSSIFEENAVLVPKKSGFDLTHENLFTATTGTLVPCLVELLVPSDRVTLGVSYQVKLPPMCCDFYGRIDAEIHTFFVPLRSLYGGWKSFFATGASSIEGNTPVIDDTYIEKVASYLPSITLNTDDTEEYADDYREMIETLLGRGTLYDYLGGKCNFEDWTVGTFDIKNILPMLAYHKVYSDWFRDSTKEKPAFVHPVASMDADNQWNAATLPFVRFTDNDEVNVELLAEDFSQSGVPDSMLLNDGVSLFSLRQRNFSKDYYTTSQSKPQAGDAVKVSVNAGAFSVAQMRVANSLQMFLERSQAAGWKYKDQIRSRFGVTPPDCAESIFLGRTSVGVYNHSIFSDNGNLSESTAANKNPFFTGNMASPAAEFATSGALNEGDSLVDTFEAKEHGFLISLFSLVPHAYYSTGRRRYLDYSRPFDFADPLFAGLGPQEVKVSELTGDTSTTVFGYADHFSEYKYHDDEIHGKLADGESLDCFALQRSFDPSVRANSAFNKIPIDYLDQVTASSVSSSGFTCWVDLFNALKIERPLPRYVIPTLGTPAYMGIEKAPRNGRRF